MVYKDFLIIIENGRVFVSLKERGMLYCRNIQEAKSYIDHLTRS